MWWKPQRLHYSLGGTGVIETIINHYEREKEQFWKSRNRQLYREWLEKLLFKRSGDGFLHILNQR